MTIRYQTNPLFRGGWFLRDDDPSFVGELVGGDISIGSDEVGKLSCLYYSSKPKTREEIIDALVSNVGIEKEAANSTFDWLLEHEFLVSDRDYDDAIEQWIDSGWRFALYFHEYMNRSYSGGSRTFQLDGESEMGFTGTIEGSVTSEELRRLPSPPPFPERPIEEILLERETCRDFSGRYISLREFSGILEYGLVWDSGIDLMAARRATHFHVYPFVSRVGNLSSGVYKFIPDEHGIVPIDQSYSSEEMDELITNLVVGQSYAEQSGVVLFITIDFSSIYKRTSHTRGLRTAYLLLSQMAHMALLAATAFGIATFQTAAFEDSNVANVLQTDRFVEGPGYVLAFGHDD